MKFSLETVVGPEAFKRLKEPDFVSRWSALAASDLKISLYQRPEFVIPWYKAYAGKYEPVMCLGYGEDGGLRGIMPLARSFSDKRIVHAGDGQAAYHGWICPPEMDEEFPLACLLEVKRLFCPRIWRWRWMPPNASVKWLDSPVLRQNGIHAKTRLHGSPVLDLNDEEAVNRALRHKSLRSYLNHYEKRGGFRLERVKEIAKTGALIDEMASQVDFRRGARYGKMPFGEDECKRRFLIERQTYPEQSHFTVLWSEGRPIAFNFGACDSERVTLGSSVYSPLEGKYSPGTVFLITLARSLREEGFRYLDFTPGSEQYKERLSNRKEDVLMPVFYFSRLARLRAELVGVSVSSAKMLLRLFGIKRPDERLRIYEGAKKAFSRLRTATPEKAAKKIGRFFYSETVKRYYKITLDENKGQEADSSRINVQRYGDLLLYSGSASGPSRREVLKRALSRFSAEDTLYSVSEEGVLVHYGWMKTLKAGHVLSGVDMVFGGAEGGVLLYDFYTDPRFRRMGYYAENVKKMLYDCRQKGIREVFIGVALPNEPSEGAVKKLGFSLYRTYRKRKILWMVKKEEF